MCKRVEGSGSRKVVFWTVSPPFSKGKPGFVTTTTGSGFEGEVTFTEDIWYALAMNREDSANVLSNLRRRTPLAIYTHEAIAQLVVA